MCVCVLPLLALTTNQALPLVSYNVGSHGGLQFNIRLAIEVANCPGALWFIWHSMAQSNPSAGALAADESRLDQKTSYCTDRAMLLALNMVNTNKNLGRPHYHIPTHPHHLLPLPI